MGTGYVALIDVLGFSALISGDHAKRLESYLQGLRDAFEAAPEPKGLEYVVFSDSIIVTTSDDSEASLAALLVRCSMALGILLERNIALRGAISHGSFTRERTSGGTFVAGRPIVDAYRYEQLQDWVGIMITPSVLTMVPDLKDKCRLKGNFEEGEIRNDIRRRLPWPAVVQPADIRFHAPHDRYDGFAVVPSGGSLDFGALSGSLSQSLEKLSWLKALAPDPSAQSKYTETHKWLIPIRKDWTNIAGYHQQRPATVDNPIFVRLDGVDRHATIARVVSPTIVNVKLFDEHGNFDGEVAGIKLAENEPERLVENRWWLR